MPFTLAVLVALSGALHAAPCDETAELRIQSARDLLAGLPDAEPIDRSSVAERAAILLERTLADAPGCDDASALLDEATSAAAAAEAESSAAARADAIAELTARLEAQEAREAADPESVEAIRFALAELASQSPDDEQIPALQERAAALGGAR